MLAGGDEQSTVLLNNGTGTFFASGQSLPDAAFRAVAMGDIDGDGDLDAMVGPDDEGPNQVWLWEPTEGLVIGDVNRDGAFDGQDVLQVLRVGYYRTGR